MVNNPCWQIKLHAFQTAPIATFTGTFLHCSTISDITSIRYYLLLCYLHRPTVTELHRPAHLQMMTASHSQQQHKVLVVVLMVYHCSRQMAVCMSTACIRGPRLCLVAGHLHCLMTSVMTTTRASHMTVVMVTSSHCCHHSRLRLYASVAAAAPVVKNPPMLTN